MSILAAHWLSILLGLVGTAGIGALSWLFPLQALLVVRAVWDWLCHRSFWQLVSLGLACVIVVQHFTIVHDRAEAARWEKQYSALEGQVKKQAGESKAQQKQITKVVDHYITVTKPEVRTVVQKIENAPLKLGCQTPDLVMGADV